MNVQSTRSRHSSGCLRLIGAQGNKRAWTYHLSYRHGASPVLGKTALQRCSLCLVWLDIGCADPQHVSVHETRGLYSQSGNCKFCRWEVSGIDMDAGFDGRHGALLCSWDLRGCVDAGVGGRVVGGAQAGGGIRSSPSG